MSLSCHRHCSKTLKAGHHGSNFSTSHHRLDPHPHLISRVWLVVYLVSTYFRCLRCELLNRFPPFVILLRVQIKQAVDWLMNATLIFDWCPRNHAVETPVKYGHYSGGQRCISQNKKNVPHCKIHGWGFSEPHISQWRHNQRDSVSNRRCLDYLLDRLFRHRSKKASKLRVTGLCEGIHQWPVNSLHQRPVTRKFWSLTEQDISQWEKALQV